MSLAPIPTEPAHDDPLATAAERVPLAWPRFDQPISTETPSQLGVRPFGLRYAVDTPAGGAPLPPWTYCPDRQIAVGQDGKPWLRSADEDEGPSMKTTGPSPDGGPSTGGEEWTPDFMSDEVG
jgi:putative ATP-grasp target RiPP